MEEFENLVEETENTEQLTAEEEVEQVEGETTEEVVEEPETKQEETFTKEQVDEMIAKKLARAKAKMERQFARQESKHRDFENLVMAGTETNSPEEAYNKLNDFYTQRGITIPKQNMSYDDRDIEILADNDAREIIEAGYEEIVEEVERLNEMGYENLSERDKILFRKIATERQRIEDMKDLETIGVNYEDINNEEFKNFTSKLNPNLSLKEKYEMYVGSKPKKEIKKIGSMKNEPTANTELKDFYTREEAMKFKPEDFDKYPELEGIIVNSMKQW